MKISDVIDILSAEVVWGDAALCDREVQNACGSDLMSDVLAYVKDQSLLLTGLVNPQVIRTAEMMDFVCIVFVRGKRPDPAMIELASEYGIVLLTTRHRMFTAGSTPPVWKGAHCERRHLPLHRPGGRLLPRRGGLQPGEKPPQAPRAPRRGDPPGVHRPL